MKLLALLCVLPTFAGAASIRLSTACDNSTWTKGGSSIDAFQVSVKSPQVLALGVCVRATLEGANRHGTRRIRGSIAPSNDGLTPVGEVPNVCWTHTNIVLLTSVLIYSFLNPSRWN